VRDTNISSGNLGRVTVAGSMRDRVILALGLILICFMPYSNGEIASKTIKNELPKERRKIVKLLLRNFPLQESASYHNLVEEDEAGQPIARGSSMTKYAPAYPYQEEPMSKLASTKPVAKLLLKSPDISKFEYALSTILLPPPVSQSQTYNNDEADAEVYYAPYIDSNVDDDDMYKNTEENADIFYEPYMQNMYQNEEYFPKNTASNADDDDMYKNTEENADIFYEPYMQNMYQYGKSIPENTANNADIYYAPYIKQAYGSSNPEEEMADEYYTPYMNYNQEQQQDQWLQYFYRQPLPVTHTEYQELPQHDASSLYEGPVDDLIVSEEETLPEAHENEIFDVPRVILKLNQ